MITLIFSMLGPRLDDAQADQFSAFAQWVILNERDGRILIDTIDPENPVYTRPVEFSEIHRWAGWEPKQ